MIEEKKYVSIKIIRLLLFVVLAVFTGFLMGYLSGLNVQIPEHSEFGLDQKTIDVLDRLYNESIEAKCINYNEPFENATYGLGGIQR
jgi:hypothetical protein